MTINENDFKHSLATFATGVTVVTTVDTNGILYGVTINSFSSVSLSPPLVMFCLDVSSSVHDVFQASQHFVVNILSAKQEDVSKRFASQEEEKWIDTPHHIAKESGCPILEDTLAHIACKRYATHLAGDHTIIIGEVVGLEHNQDGKKPLLYYQSKYTGLAE